MASQHKKWMLNRWVALAVLLVPVIGGCHLFNKCHTCGSGLKAPATVPPPPGEYVRTIFERQAENAEADDFVIYEHEWVRDTANLAPFGTYHIVEISRRLPEVPFPVVIQIHPDQALNRARQDFVINYLAGQGIPDAHQRVVIGFPRAEGLPGEEAVPLYYEYITTRYRNNLYGLGGGFGAFSRFGGINRTGYGYGFGAGRLVGFTGGFIR